MEAALTTLYLLAFTISYFGKPMSPNDHKRVSQPLLDEPREDALRTRDIPKPRLVERTLNALGGSLDTFLTTSMIMRLRCSVRPSTSLSRDTKNAPFRASAVVRRKRRVQHGTLSYRLGIFRVPHHRSILLNNQARQGRRWHVGGPAPAPAHEQAWRCLSYGLLSPWRCS